MTKPPKKLGTLVYAGVVVLLASLFSLSSCNDRAVEVGSGMLPDTINAVYIDTDTVISDLSTILERRSVAAASSLFLGSNEALRAYGFVRFVGIPDTLGTVTVDSIESAQLIIHPLRYGSGDTVANRIGFTVHKITQPWLPTATLDSINLSTFFESRVLARYSNPIPYLDTIPSIELALEKDLVVEWLRNKSMTKNDSLIYGLFFQPEATSTVIRGFSKRQVTTPSAPTTSLRIVRRRPNGYDTLLLNDGGIAGSVFETLNPGSLLRIRSGVSESMKVLLNVTGIPKGSLVYRTELSIFLDSSKSVFSNQGQPTLLVGSLVDSSLGSTNGVFRSRDFLGARVGTTDEYRFPFLAAATDALLRMNGIAPLIVKAEPRFEASRQDLYVFHSKSDPDTSKRPRVRILYTNRPNPQ